MRRFVAGFLVVSVLALLHPSAASAASDNQLKNRRGSVAVQSGGATRQVALNAASPIGISDTAVTGANSQGELVLPDSSYIVIGQNTQVRVDQFNLSDIAHASFTLVQGKIRFKVVHPAGQTADYTFKTGTAQIAVRGTEGDVEFNNTTLQVNVYSTTNPAGVQVTLGNGQIFTLHAGQSLIVHFGAAAVAATGGVGSVTTGSVQPFAEFGLPANAGALGLIGPLAGLGVLPVIGAVIVPIAAVTIAGNQTTSTTAGPHNTTVPVRIQVKLFKWRLP